MGSQLVWNLTVPDTSPQFKYGSFVQKCPNLVQGTGLCDGNSAHVSNSPTATLSVDFYGSAIYLFGNVTQGMSYATTLDSGKAVDGTASGNLLAKYENLPNQSGSGKHHLELATTQPVEGGVLSFTGALISVKAPGANANLVVTTYNVTDPAFNFTPGWARNGTYKQSGTDVARQATLSFNGSAALLWGQCGSHLQAGSGSTSTFGEVTIDTGSPVSIVDSTTPNLPAYSTKKCLMLWDTSLTEGVHKLTLDSNLANMLISEVDVLSVAGARGSSSKTSVTAGAAGGFSLPTAPVLSAATSTPSSGASSGTHINLGTIIGIAAVVFFVLACCGGFLRRRRHQVQTYHYVEPAVAIPVMVVPAAPRVVLTTVGYS